MLTSIFAEAFRSLRHNFFQTILSVLGIIIGVSALVTMLALIDGLEKLARDGLAENTSMESVVITPNDFKTVDGLRVRKDRTLRLTPGMVDSMMAFLPYPATADLLAGGNTLVDLPDTNARVGVRYSAVSLPVHDDYALAAGRRLEARDTTAGRAGAVINYALADRLTGADSAATALGTRITVADREMEIIGILEEEEGQSMMAAIFPLPLLLADAGAAQNLNLTAQVNFEAVEDIRPAVDTLEAYFATTYPEVEEPFRVLANVTILEGIEIGFTIFRLVMSFLIGIAVVVGGVGVMNVLLMAIKERTSEIGVRKALGATRRRIMAQFLGESVAISLIGSVLGTILGMLVALLSAFVISSYAEGVDFRAVFTPRTLLIVAVVALLTGIIFGTYPARRAARLDPVDAIRS